MSVVELDYTDKDGNPLGEKVFLDDGARPAW